MNAIKSFLMRRWKQMAGVGAVWLVLEVVFALFVVWGVGQVG